MYHWNKDIRLRVHTTLKRAIRFAGIPSVGLFLTDCVAWAVLRWEKLVGTGWGNVTHFGKAAWPGWEM
jgi:hypothetical protein